MRKWLKLLLNRITLVLILALIQMGLFVYLVIVVSSFWQWNLVFIVTSMIIVLFLISRDEHPSYKLAWILPIMIFPVAGGAFYLFYRYRNLSPKTLKRHLDIEKNRTYFLHGFKTSPMSKDATYLKRHGWHPYQHTQALYLPSGEAMFETLLNDIKQAEDFIFLEFFIIKQGHMWTTLLNALKEKAAQGIEVQLIYDDFGAGGLPLNYPKKLKAFGIQAHKFNPLKLRLNFGNNYRNHRKIVVIDNRLGYSVGNNIGDEYINLNSPYGHWLDTGIRLEGEAVWSLTLAFLDVLSFVSREMVSYERYYKAHKAPSDGVFLPFADTPLDAEETTKNIYISMIYSAQESIKITTPYLIIDPDFKHALRYAAKAGVRVSIILPAIPDKKLIYMVTQSYWPALIQDGVHIYTYTPGFMHAKMMIIDDTRAMIGTANLDYRSLYLHFENSVYIEHASVIQTMREHYHVLMEQSLLIDQDYQERLLIRGVQLFLRMFATML